MNRRQFLTMSALSGSGLMMQGNYNPALAADRPNGYRAIVNIYLQGGNDINMLVPANQYQAYGNIRGGLAIDQNRFLNLTSIDGNTTRNYGLHPSCSSMKDRYEDGNLAFVANIGALRAPLNRQEFIARTKPFPPRLFAHNSQSKFVIAGLPFEGERLTGWGGRVADSYNVPASQPPLGVSMVGESLWLRGQSASQFSFGSGVGPVVNYRTDIPVFENLYSRSTKLEALRELSYDNIFIEEISRRYKDSLANSRLYQGDRLDDRVINTPFPSGVLAQQLKNVMRLINSRALLGQNQQMFSLVLGGWDFHAGLLTRQAANLTQLSDSLSAFYLATQEFGLANNVTTMTTSDFGRTLSGNGNGGSDHGWGGTQIVMGGAINGGRVYGEFPNFSDSDPHFLTSGNFIPTIAMDQLSSAVAGWFGGFTDSELEGIFPNLTNFTEKRLDVYT